MQRRANVPSEVMGRDPRAPVQDREIRTKCSVALCARDSNGILKGGATVVACPFYVPIHVSRASIRSGAEHVLQSVVFSQESQQSDPIWLLLAFNFCTSRDSFESMPQICIRKRIRLKFLTLSSCSYRNYILRVASC